MFREIYWDYAIANESKRVILKDMRYNHGISIKQGN